MKRSNTVSSRGTRWLRYLGTLACVFLALFFTMHWWLGLVPLPPALLPRAAGKPRVARSKRGKLARASSARLGVWPKCSSWPTAEEPG